MELLIFIFLIIISFIIVQIIAKKEQAKKRIEEKERRKIEQENIKKAEIEALKEAEEEYKRKAIAETEEKAKKQAEQKRLKAKQEAILKQKEVNLEEISKQETNKEKERIDSENEKRKAEQEALLKQKEINLEEISKQEAKRKAEQEDKKKAEQEDKRRAEQTNEYISLLNIIQAPQLKLLSILKQQVNKLTFEAQKENNNYTKTEDYTKKGKIFEITLDRGVLIFKHEILKQLYELKYIDTDNVKSITSINLPESYQYNGNIYKITRIETLAFKDFSNLESINIPKSVTYIGEEAFEKCLYLKEIIIHNSKKNIEIKKRAFNKLQQIIFTEDEENYKQKIIELKTKEQEVSFNKTVILQLFTMNNRTESIWTFKNIDIPEKYQFNGINYKITSIGDYAFSNNRKLKKIYIPSNIKSIGRESFCSCTALKDIKIAEGLETIGELAFGLSTALETIKIPNSVTSIKKDAFRSCSALKNVTLSKNLKNVETWAFSECSSLESIIIPDGVEIIGSSAFSKCTSLKDVNIPNSVTTIKNNAFAYCSSLENIYIPNSVTSIQYNAFAGCNSLKEVIIDNKKKNVKIGKNAFDKDVNIIFTEDEKKAKINIQLDLLEKIRQDSLTTCDSLLTEEEKIEEAKIEKANKDIKTTFTENEEKSKINVNSPTLTNDFSNNTSLNSEQIQILTKLLQGESVKETLKSWNKMPEVFADSLNDVLFDEIGDTVVECTDDDIILIEDYRNDINQLLKQTI